MDIASDDNRGTHEKGASEQGDSFHALFVQRLLDPDGDAHSVRAVLHDRFSSTPWTSDDAWRAVDATVQGLRSFDASRTEASVEELGRFLCSVGDRDVDDDGVDRALLGLSRACAGVWTLASDDDENDDAEDDPERRARTTATGERGDRTALDRGWSRRLLVWALSAAVRVERRRVDREVGSVHRAVVSLVVDGGRGAPSPRSWTLACAALTACAPYAAAPRRAAWYGAVARNLGDDDADVDPAALVGLCAEAVLAAEVIDEDDEDEEDERLLLRPEDLLPHIYRRAASTGTEVLVAVEDASSSLSPCLAERMLTRRTDAPAWAAVNVALCALRSSKCGRGSGGSGRRRVSRWAAAALRVGGAVERDPTDAVAEELVQFVIEHVNETERETEDGDERSRRRVVSPHREELACRSLFARDDASATVDPTRPDAIARGRIWTETAVSILEGTREFVELVPRDAVDVAAGALAAVARHLPLLRDEVERRVVEAFDVARGFRGGDDDEARRLRWCAACEAVVVATTTNEIEEASDDDSHNASRPWACLVTAERLATFSPAVAERLLRVGATFPEGRRRVLAIVRGSLLDAAPSTINRARRVDLALVGLCALLRNDDGDHVGRAALSVLRRVLLFHAPSVPFSARATWLSASSELVRDEPSGTSPRTRRLLLRVSLCLLSRFFSFVGDFPEPKDLAACRSARDALLFVPKRCVDPVANSEETLVVADDLVPATELLLASHARARRESRPVAKDDYRDFLLDALDGASTISSATRENQDCDESETLENETPNENNDNGSSSESRALEALAEAFATKMARFVARRGEVRKRGRRILRGEQLGELLVAPFRDEVDASRPIFGHQRHRSLSDVATPTRRRPPRRRPWSEEDRDRLRSALARPLLAVLLRRPVGGDQCDDGGGGGGDVVRNKRLSDAVLSLYTTRSAVVAEGAVDDDPRAAASFVGTLASSFVAVVEKDETTTMTTTTLALTADATRAVSHYCRVLIDAFATTAATERKNDDDGDDGEQEETATTPTRTTLGGSRAFVPLSEHAALATSLWDLYSFACDETRSVALLERIENDPSFARSLGVSRRTQSADAFVRALRYHVVEALSRTVAAYAKRSLSRTQDDHDLLDQERLFRVIEGLSNDLRLGLRGRSGAVSSVLFASVLRTIDDVAGLLHLRSRTFYERAEPAVVLEHRRLIARASLDLYRVLCEHHVRQASLIRNTLRTALVTLPSLARRLCRVAGVRDGEEEEEEEEEECSTRRCLDVETTEHCLALLRQWNVHKAAGEKDSAIWKRMAEESSSSDHETVRVATADEWSWTLDAALHALERNVFESHRVVRSRSDDDDDNSAAAAPRLLTEAWLTRFCARRARNLARASRCAESFLERATTDPDAPLLAETLSDDGKRRLTRLLDRISATTRAAAARVSSGAAASEPSVRLDSAVLESLVCLAAWASSARPDDEPRRRDLASGARDWYARERRRYAAQRRARTRAGLHVENDRVLRALPPVLSKIEAHENALQSLLDTVTRDEVASRTAEYDVVLCVLTNRTPAEGELRRLLEEYVAFCAASEKHPMSLIVDIPNHDDDSGRSGDGRNDTSRPNRVKVGVKRRRPRNRVERNQQILRSRNETIDNWLDLDRAVDTDEEDDAFVDLEDFLVDG